MTSPSGQVVLLSRCLLNENVRRLCSATRLDPIVPRATNAV
ncbi:hypothetical protein [Nonomuraea turcica]|nr:hypothetical protein [Nonomuraea sp. G32]MDP4510042.1 hypothetical protein [Nonomuraea sp. G32]